MYEIILLEPVIAFIDRLDVKMQAKVLRTVDLLEQFGPFLPMPHSKKLTGYELYELRVKLATNIVRLFYFHDKGKVCVVTSGYVKKTDRTSKGEIEKAIKLKAQFYEERRT